MSKNWPRHKLGEIFEIARGGSPRPIEKFLTSDPNGLNWIKISDASGSGKYIKRTRDRIRPEGLSKTRYVKPGDFLLTNSMSFGRPYIMATEGCIHDGCLVLSPRDEGKIDRDFFYHLLGSRPVYERFAARAGGSTVKNLNSDIVSELEIAFHPRDEQRRIAAILDKADVLRRNRGRALELLSRLPRSIFLEMFGHTSSFDAKPLADFIDAGDKINYGVVQPGEEIANGIPLVRVSDLKNGRVDHSNLRNVSGAISDKHRRSLLRGFLMKVA